MKRKKYSDDDVILHHWKRVGRLTANEMICLREIKAAHSAAKAAWESFAQILAVRVGVSNDQEFRITSDGEIAVKDRI